MYKTADITKWSIFYSSCYRDNQIDKLVDQLYKACGSL